MNTPEQFPKSTQAQHVAARLALLDQNGKVFDHIVPIELFSDPHPV